MKKQIIGYLFARGVPGLLNFLLIIKLTHILQPHEYGRYALIIATSTFINISIFQWNKASLGRLLHVDGLEGQGLISSVGTVFTVSSLIFIIASSLVWVIFEDSIVVQTVLISFVLGSLMGWQDLTLELLRAKQRTLLFSFVSILKPFFMLLAVYELPIFKDAHALAALFAASTLLSLAPPLKISLSFIRLSIEKRHLRQIISFGLPLAIGYIAGYAVSTLNRVLLGWIESKSSAGIYSASFDIVWQTIVMLMMTVNLANYPTVMKSFESHKREAAIAGMRQNLSSLLVLTLPFVILFCISPHELANILLPAEFRAQAVWILPIISISAFLMGIRSYHFDISFQIYRNTKTQTLLSLLLGIVSVPLSFVMIKFFGIFGAACSTLMVYAAHLIATIFIVKRDEYVRYSFDLLQILILPCLGMPLAFTLLSSLAGFGYIYKAAISIAVFYVLYTLAVRSNVRQSKKSAVVIFRLESEDEYGGEYTRSG